MTTTQPSHPNSRVITIYRTRSFLVDAQSGSAPEFLALSKKSIGSYWEKSYSKVVGSGLSFAEQKLLMPLLVDCEPEDRQFREKVSEYFKVIRTPIPYEKGRELEIGLESDNSKPVSKDNMPINLSDYIIYRHALHHPQVAATKAEGDGNMLKEFYIFDPQVAEETTVKAAQAKDKALEVYLQLKKEAEKSPEKLDMVLTVLGVDPRTISGKNAIALKSDKLKSLAEADPARFTTSLGSKFFQEQYRILSMINTGVFTRVGELIIDRETGDTIGHTMDEAVAWIKDPKHSDRLVLLMARMQEGLKAPAPAAVKASS